MTAASRSASWRPSPWQDEGVKVVVAVALLAGCGRLGFDPTTMTSGDGGGSGSGSSCPTPPAATLTIHAGDDLYGMLATLPAGSVVEVEAGTYNSPGNAPMTWNGTAAAPIIVRAAANTRPVLVNTPGNNGLDLYGAYFTLQGFEMTGGDMGVRLGGVNHVTLEDLYIHDVVDEGITCNRTSMSCDSLELRRIEVGPTGNTMTGNAITLGCSDQTCGATNAVVEGCYFHDLMGSGGAGLSVWKHSGVTARDNVVYTAAGPGIVLQQTASSGRDTLERNLLWNIDDNAIQVEGQVIVRNNLIIGGTSDGVHSRMELSTAPTNVDILHNTITGPGGDCIHGLNWSGSAYVLANNAMACGTSNVVVTGSPVESADLTVMGSDVGTLPNAYPTAGSALVDTGDATHSAVDDFNATTRSGTPDIGAYERTAASNPGWLPTMGMKPITSGCP